MLHSVMDAVQWLQFRAEWSDDNIQLHDLDAGDHCQSGRFYPENCTISIVCHACKREMYRKEGAQFD